MIVYEPIPLHQAEALSNLAQRIYKQHYTYLWSPENLVSYLHEVYSPAFFAHCLQDPNYAIFWAKEEIPLGYVMLKKKQPLPTKQPASYLHRIYLAEEAQGLGIGKKLMGLAETEAQKAGNTSIWLHAMKSGRAAIQFYEYMGFCKNGEEVFDMIPLKTPELAKMWIMTKTLNMPI